MSRGLVLVCAATLAVVSVSVHVVIESRFAHAGVLHEGDVLFDADPNVYSLSFRTGRNLMRWGGRSFVHPHISNTIYPLISAAVGMGHAVRPQTDTATIRQNVVLVISPLAAGGESVLVFLTMLELGAGILGSLLIGALSVVAFSGLVFGSLPESYPLSGAALAAMFWLAAHTARTRRIVLWQWVLAGFVVASITITNLAAAVILAWTAFRAAGIPWRVGTRRTLLGAVAILAAVALLYEGAAQFIPDAPRFIPSGSGQIDELGGFSSDKALRGFPAALANSLAPPRPRRVPNPDGPQAHNFTITYRSAAGVIPHQSLHTAVALVFLILGAIGARWMAGWQRAIMLAALAVIAFSWVLHAWYGTELLLYSQHWLVAELLVIGGLLWYPSRWRFVPPLAPTALLIACLVDNTRILRIIFDTLST